MSQEESNRLPDHIPSTAKYRRGCRCSGCRAENARYQREYQAAKKAKLLKQELGN